MRNPTRCPFIFVALLAGTAAFAQDMPSDYAGVLKTLGKQADYKDNVFEDQHPQKLPWGAEVGHS